MATIQCFGSLPLGTPQGSPQPWGGCFPTSLAQASLAPPPQESRGLEGWPWAPPPSPYPPECQSRGHSSTTPHTPVTPLPAVGETGFAPCTHMAGSGGCEEHPPASSCCLAPWGAVTLFQEAFLQSLKDQDSLPALLWAHPCRPHLFLLHGSLGVEAEGVPQSVCLRGVHRRETAHSPVLSGLISNPGSASQLASGNQFNKVSGELRGFCRSDSAREKSSRYVGFVYLIRVQSPRNSSPGQCPVCEPGSSPAPKALKEVSVLRWALALTLPLLKIGINKYVLRIK